MTYIAPFQDSWLLDAQRARAAKLRRLSALGVAYVALVIALAALA